MKGGYARPLLVRRQHDPLLGGLGAPRLSQADHNQGSPTGLLWKDGTLTPPSPEVRETLMGFTSGATDATGLSPAQRIHILGMCTDLNILHWTMA